MKNLTVIAGFVLCLLAVTAMATPTSATHKTPVKAAVVYECQVCHMKVSAAVAKKDHYHDPMDGGALVPVKPVIKTGAPAGGAMGGMKM